AVVAPEGGGGVPCVSITADGTPQSPPLVESRRKNGNPHRINPALRERRRTRLSTTQKFEFQLSLTSSLSDLDEANGAIVRTLLRQGPVEAGACARMAGHPVALDVCLEPQHVLIAIRPDFSNAKEVAALLALLPDALPRAR